MNPDELGSVTTNVWLLRGDNLEPQWTQTIRQPIEEVSLSADGGITLTTQTTGMKIEWTLDTAMWRLLSRWYALHTKDQPQSEPPPPETPPSPVLCADCKHRRSGWLYGDPVGTGNRYNRYMTKDRCEVSRRGFVGHDLSNFAMCETVNPDGRCKLFQPIPPPVRYKTVHVPAPRSRWQVTLDTLREPIPLVVGAVMCFTGIIIGRYLR